MAPNDLCFLVGTRLCIKVGLGDQRSGRRAGTSFPDEVMRALFPPPSLPPSLSQLTHSEEGCWQELPTKRPLWQRTENSNPQPVRSQSLPPRNTSDPGRRSSGPIHVLNGHDPGQQPKSKQKDPGPDPSAQLLQISVSQKLHKVMFAMWSH